LNPEGPLIGLQLTPLTWHPRPKPDTPMLGVAGGADALFSEKEERRLAAFYGAEFKLFPGTAHNVMVEHTYEQSARFIHDWLVRTGIT
jgi:pimeloyl-ACP methyl ester carboxylesterase